MNLTKLYGVVFLVCILWVIFHVRHLILFCWREPHGEFSTSLPIVGLHKQTFRTLRACLRQLTGGLQSMLEGFNKYTIHGQSYLLPDPTFRMELMLPPEQIKWLLEQPERVLSHWRVRDARHAIDYTVGNVDILPMLAFLSKIIQFSLSRRLNLVQGAIYRTIQSTVDDVFGHDEVNWTEHKLDHSMEEIVGLAMARVLYGAPLSQDRSFRWHFNMMVKAMGITRLVLGQMPKVLQPLFAAVLSIPLRYFRSQATKKLEPIVRQRYQETNSKIEAQIMDAEQDLITQAINNMESLGESMSPELLAQRLLILGFAGISPTTSVAATTMVDILATPSDLNICSKIREEATSHLRTEADWNNPDVFSSLELTSSAVHESLRMRPTMLKGLTREVVPKGGIEVPDGTHAPEGAWISVPVHAIHMDERLYEDPTRYDPFRFLPAYPQAGKDPQGFKTGASDQPSATFLTFGFGRYACPGRKYGIHVLKVLLAYIFVHYDVELLSTPPKFSSIGDVGLPPIGMTIRVRRRRNIQG